MLKRSEEKNGVMQTNKNLESQDIQETSHKWIRIASNDENLAGFNEMRAFFKFATNILIIQDQQKRQKVYDCIWQNKPRNACENSTEQQNILSVYLPLSMNFSTILQKYPIKSRLLFSCSHFRTYAEIIYRQEISIEI